MASLKLLAGFVSGSYAVIADGIDSISDIVSSLVVLVAARIIARPPNIKFPYGYKKADTVATKVLSFIIFFAGAQLAWSTIQTLLAGSAMEIPGRLALWVTVISIPGKLILTRFLSRTGRKVESTMLIANARNMRNDILLSISVLLSLLFTEILHEPLIDRIIALLISLIVGLALWQPLPTWLDGPARLTAASGGLLVLAIVALLYVRLRLSYWGPQMINWTGLAAGSDSVGPLGWLTRPIGRLLDGLEGIRHPQVMLAAGSWSVLAWFLGAITILVLLKAFSLPCSMGLALFLLAVLQLGVAVPSVPGRIGSRRRATMSPSRAARMSWRSQA